MRLIARKPVSYGKPRTRDHGGGQARTGWIDPPRDPLPHLARCGRDLKSAEPGGRGGRIRTNSRGSKYWERASRPGRVPHVRDCRRGQGQGHRPQSGNGPPRRPTKNSKYLGVKATVRVRRVVGTSRRGPTSPRSNEKTITIAADEQESCFNRGCLDPALQRISPAGTPDGGSSRRSAPRPPPEVLKAMPDRCPGKSPSFVLFSGPAERPL